MFRLGVSCHVSKAIGAMMYPLAVPSVSLGSHFKKRGHVIPRLRISIRGYADALEGIATDIAVNSEDDFKHIQFSYVGRACPYYVPGEQ